MAYYICFFLIIASAIAYFVGNIRIRSMVRSDYSKLRSSPGYHGIFLILTTTGIPFVLFFLWLIVSGTLIESLIKYQFSEEFSKLGFLEIQNLLADSYNAVFNHKPLSDNSLAAVVTRKYSALHFSAVISLITVMVLCIVVGWLYGWKKITPAFGARQIFEKVAMFFLLAYSTIAILITFGIVLSLIFETIQFFEKVSFLDFLFGIHWSPQNAYLAAGSEGIPTDNSRIFGAIPLFTGTLMITLISISVAAPIGLMSAIYLSDYASQKFRAFAKPLLEILAGIPTVVYGFFAAVTVAPNMRGIGEWFGLGISSESALTAGIVMGIMIIPFVSSLSDDVINAVPQSLRDASIGLGATKSETIKKVVLPAALPGIVSSLLLAVSRAIGETMIVVMAAGLAANLTINPLEAVTTVTVQIVTLLVGDQEFDSAKTLAAFALGLVLFCITLILNIIALRIVLKYREQYE